MNRGIHTLRLDEQNGLSFHLSASLFNTIVDSGCEIIVIITPKRRYVASVDDWMDYGYFDVDDDEDIIVLNKSYMGV